MSRRAAAGIPGGGAAASGPHLGACVAVVPARWGSTRLPGKPLADLGGLPMIEHVRRRVLAASSVSRVVVATDDPRIAEVVAGFGGEVALTGPQPSGTHRVAAAVASSQAAFVVNVQGDMPLVDPRHIDALVALLRDGASIATLCVPVEPELAAAPAVVKVVRRFDGRALLFSRLPVPLGGPFFRHLGLYGFRRAALDSAVLAPTDGLAASEDLEQLAWLEAGLDVHVGVVERASPSVDTPAQLDAMRASWGRP